MQNNIQDGRNDFDFFVGTWNVHNRQLKERLANSDEWVEFEGVSVARKILGGLGNLDEMVLEKDSTKIYGLTLRTFNPDTKEWSLYWSDSRHGTLVAPMIGKFENGCGEFYAHETHNNQHIFSRFIWSDISESSCHWEQAFSPDGGKTWETNWTMDMTKQQEK